eukprot:1156250-Pelagomonas_calceolata.AAC.4
MAPFLTSAVLRQRWTSLACHHNPGHATEKSCKSLGITGAVRPRLVCRALFHRWLLVSSLAAAGILLLVILMPCNPLALYNCRGGCPMASMPGKGLVPIPTAKATAPGDPGRALAGIGAAEGRPQDPKGHQEQQASAAVATTGGAVGRRRAPSGKRAGEAAGSPAQEVAPPQGAGYQLSTVICHKGDITGGHYVAYVRNMGAWFRCDDAWVTLVSEQEVAQCQAYMLFFVQSTFA